MAKRNKKYSTNNKFNPVFQAKKIERLQELIDKHGKSIQAISKSHDNHISYLGNFAKHDIKNAILSMDSILSTTEAEDFDSDKIASLSTYLGVIRETIDNFAKLVPYSANGNFKLDALFNTAELLSRSDMQHNKIDLKMIYERESNIIINLPFQSLIQMMNNLIINSTKALEMVENKKLRVEGEIESDILRIIISDNGKIITPEEQKKVFDFGYTTTGGSGIGLYHAKYLCEQFNGEILLKLTPDEEFNKSFCITFPTVFNNGENDINN